MRNVAHSSFLPGGCVWPPAWPPRPPEVPDEKSEYGREFLREDFDWMGIPHPTLYRMVHDGLNLGSVVEAAASWGKFGDEMEEIGHDLRRSLEESAHGWQGDAAEQARTTMRRLSEWTEQTAHRGNEISSCISRQAELAEHAKQAMPEPMLVTRPQPLPVPGPGPVPVSSDGGGTAPMSASSFTQGGFAGAAVLPEDHLPPVEGARERHREAARVMRQLQHDSFDVYRDVPRFTRPDGQRTNRHPDDDRDRGDDDDRDDDKQHDEDEHDGDRDDTTTSSAGGGTAPGTPSGGAPPAGARVPSGGHSPAGGAVAGPALGAGTSSGELATGKRAGAALPSTSSGLSAQSSAPAGGTSRGYAGGAVPMGGAGAGARPGGDTEHTVAEYLEEDSDFWSPNVTVVPPVLGEEPPGGNER